MVQLSHPYMTTGKIIALTKWTSVDKVMSLLFNMLSRFVVAFLPRSKCLLMSWLQSPSIMILEPKKIKSVTSAIFSSSVCYEVMWSDSLVAQMVENMTAMWETRVQSLGQEDPVEKVMATHFTVLARKILWTEELNRLETIGSQRVGHDWAIHTHTHTHTHMHTHTHTHTHRTRCYDLSVLNVEF